MTILIKYPLDLTGANSNNLVLKESHDISAVAKKVIAPKYGAFYAKSLKVYNGATLELLIPKVDYVAFQLHPEATEASSLECFTLIQIQGDAALIPNIKIDYQAVGGNYYLSASALQNYLDILATDNRPVYWGEIIGTPDAYPPVSHPHSASQDLIGLSTLVAAILDLKDAILAGNDAELQGLYAYIDQVMVGGAQNYATGAEGVAGVSTSKVISPSVLAHVLTQLVTNPNNTKFNNVYNYAHNDIYKLTGDLFGDGLFVDDSLKASIDGSTVNALAGKLYTKGKRINITAPLSIALPATYPSELWVKLTDVNNVNNPIPTVELEYRVGTSTIDYDYVVDTTTTYHYAKLATVTNSTTITDARATFKSRYGLLFQNAGLRIPVATGAFPSKIGKSYFLLNGSSVVLPDTTDLLVGEWVNFTRDVGININITTKVPATELIKTTTAKGKEVADATMLYNAPRELTFIWAGTYWVLVYA